MNESNDGIRPDSQISIALLDLTRAVSAWATQLEGHVKRLFATNMPPLMAALVDRLRRSSAHGVAGLLLAIACASSHADAAGDPYNLPLESAIPAQTEIHDVFYADAGVWGAELVLILRDRRAGTYVAQGYFSGKRKPLKHFRRIPREVDYAAYQLPGNPIEWDRYVYVDSGRELQRRYDNVRRDGRLPTGGRLTSTGFQLRLLSREPGQVATPLVKDLLPAELIETDAATGTTFVGTDSDHYATVIADAICEPLTSPLQYVDRDGAPVWSRFMLGKVDPPVNSTTRDKFCDDYPATFYESTVPVAVLDDEVVLLQGANQLVAIRISDGSVIRPQGEIRAFLLVDVVRAKLDIMRRAREFETACIARAADPQASLRVNYQCLGEFVYGPPRDPVKVRRGLMIDLARHLFGDYRTQN